MFFQSALGGVPQCGTPPRPLWGLPPCRSKVAWVVYHSVVHHPGHFGACLGVAPKWPGWCTMLWYTTQATLGQSGPSGVPRG
eukprot:3983676-Karenia_brevis.AAC.1